MFDQLDKSSESNSIIVSLCGYRYSCELCYSLRTIFRPISCLSLPLGLSIVLCVDGQFVIDINRLVGKIMDRLFD